MTNLEFAKQTLEWDLKHLAKSKYFMESNILSYKRNKVAVMEDKLRLWGWVTPNYNEVIYFKQKEKLESLHEIYTKQLEELYAKYEIMFNN